MDLMNIKRILGKFFYPQETTDSGSRKPFTDKDRIKRKSKNKMARKSRRRNRQ